MAESRQTAPAGTQYLRLEDGSVKPIRVKARLGLVASPAKPLSPKPPASEPTDQQ